MMATVAFDEPRFDLASAERWLPRGQLFVLSTPWAAAISSISGPRIAGLHYTGFIWLAYLAWGCWILLTTSQTPAFPIGRWSPLVALAALSTLWSGLLDSRPLQDFAQLTASLVVALAASTAVRSKEQLRALGRSFLFSLWFIVLSFVFFYFGPGKALHDPERDVGFCVRPTAMTLVLIAIVALSGLGTSRGKAWVIWSICLLITVLSASRMATLAVLVVPLVDPQRHRLLPRVGLLAALLGLGTVLFHSPIFQERFFGDRGGTLEDVRYGEFDGSGRFTMWPVLLDEAQQAPLFGRGLGTTGRFLAASSFELTQPLNDYLRLLYELGVAGVAMFLAAMATQILDVRRQMRRATTVPRRALAAASVGLMIFLLFSVTENVLVYNVYFTHPLFALLGAAYGAHSREGLGPKGGADEPRSKVR